jgi:hypothetical protein
MRLQLGDLRRLLEKGPGVSQVHPMADWPGPELLAVYDPPRPAASTGSVETPDLGASRHVLAPHPFGSWLANGNLLHVFYGLPHNGEQPAAGVFTELGDSVIIALMIRDWRGAKTLRGGFSPAHVTLELKAPLGDRIVIDNFDNWGSASGHLL